MKTRQPPLIDWQNEYFFAMWYLLPYIGMLEHMVQQKEVDAKEFEQASELYKSALVRWEFYRSKK